MIKQNCVHLVISYMHMLAAEQAFVLNVNSVFIIKIGISVTIGFSSFYVKCNLISISGYFYCKNVCRYIKYIMLKGVVAFI